MTIIGAKKKAGIKLAISDKLKFSAYVCIPLHAFIGKPREVITASKTNKMVNTLASIADQNPKVIAAC
ncbi:MAG: hypothetical protein DCF20_02185 [Pseudanabaena sp.]|nr:MAG: hypothetical protein DCF20_02185 [Pseudanabaena sp.]